MAASVAAAGNVTLPSLSTSARAVTNSQSRNASTVKCGVRRLSVHGGLKAQNQVMAMGMTTTTEQQFADLRARYSKRSAAAKGGAAASTCDVAAEIFPIIPIMSALVLVGIAVGFVLLRIEAALEESE